jgi:hypothetical protein
MVRLPNSSVGVFRRVTGKGIVRAQALPLTGTATFNILIAPGSSGDPCADGIVLASYDIVLTTGIAAVVDEIAEISQAALAIVLTNDVTICVEVTADFDGEFEIGDIFISFGTDANPTPPDPPGFEPPPPPATGETIQVPIDNVAGMAVEAPVTDTIGGVDYGIVGVLDARTPDAPDGPTTVDPDLEAQVSVDLSELGLASVETLHMATHSAWVPDLPDGFKLATLTCAYAEGGAPTTLDLVMGENTSEWSYDRPEHAAIGGVQHARASTLYTFQTTVDSASEYTGSVYGVKLDLDPTRTLSCISLSMISQTELTGAGDPDDDADGVPDGTDECPNTPSGTEVDDQGCPVDGGVTVDETFTGLAEGTGGDTESPATAAEVPDAILTVIDEATAAGASYDMLFIIDVTGSMIDDMLAVQSRLDEIIDEMIANGDGTQRAGVMTYQDLCADGEDTLVKAQDLTTDLEAVRAAIQGISPDSFSGGDLPESVYDAIVFAMENFNFQNPNRFALLIGDAPPQSPGGSCYRASFTDAVNAATAAGVDVNLYPIIAPLPGAGGVPLSVGYANHNNPQAEELTGKARVRLARTLVPEPTWAGQAFSAITLEGPAGTPSVIGDCSGATTTGCTSSLDCGADETCVSGVCVPVTAGCTSSLDCSSDETCVEGVCVPLTPGCTSSLDCGPDETCVDGTCVPGPGDDGFTAATIIHRGSEQVIAGPDVDPSVSTVTPAGYGVGGYKRTALSGDDSTVWFALHDQFPDVEGDPQTQLWRVNIDGSGGQRSMLPLDDIRQGISVETDETGSVCYADNNREGRMYRATPGAAATTAFNYFTDAEGFVFGDVRGEFKITDDGSAMVYRSFVDTRFFSVDLSAAPYVPEEMANSTSLVYLGVNARFMWWNIDFAGDGSRWFSVVEHWSSSWDPNSQAVMRVGSSLGAGATPAVHAVFAGDLMTGQDLNITDDGSTIAYCLLSGTAGLDDPNECIVEAVDGSSSMAVGDGRTTVGELLLADDGSRVFYRTTNCCSGGTGIFEDLVTGERVASGTQVFGLGWSEMRLSDDGNTLVGPSPFGVYVLRDGVDSLPNFPSIENISYRFATEGEDCKIVVRVTASSPRGIERIFVRPYIDGVDPTVFVPGPENPLFADRSGGGVNLSTTFTPVEGLENVWERDVRLTNDANECVSDLLTSDYRLRVIVRDSNLTMAVFQDFVPVP